MNSLNNTITYYGSRSLIELAVYPWDKRKPCWVDQRQCVEGMCCRCEVAGKVVSFALSQSEAENVLN